MRAIPTNYVEEGSILGENLYNAEGRILIKADTPLTAQHINKIEKNNIYTLYIKNIHTNIEVNRLLEQPFRVKGILLVKSLFDTASKGKPIFDIHQSLLTYMEDVLYEIRSYKKIQIEYVDIKNIDNYIYSSSLNVALLSSLIAWELGYGFEMVKEIFIGAIYHDIGIALLPKDITTKKEALTFNEKKQILSHPLLGYQYIKEQFFLSAYVKSIVLQHHEQIDGTGYPDRLFKNEINQMAQIIGIADVYDAMTSDRPYRRAVSPKEALEFIVGNMGKKYFYEVAQAFISRITPYPRGTIVMLSSGFPAVVEELNDQFPLRPLVKVIYKTSSGYYYERYNLMNHQNILIDYVLYESI